MKLPTLLPTLVLLSLMSFSCSTDVIEEDKIEAIQNSHIPQTKTIEVEVLELINSHRINIGLQPLNGMSTIKAEAFGHTDYMIENDEVSHANFFQRKNNLMNNVGALTVAENVAYAFSTPESVVNAWLNSEGHKNVIEGDYTDFDISAEMDENGRWYYTNIFIRK